MYVTTVFSPQQFFSLSVIKRFAEVSGDPALLFIWVAIRVRLYTFRRHTMLLWRQMTCLAPAPSTEMNYYWNGLLIHKVLQMADFFPTIRLVAFNLPRPIPSYLPLMR